MIDTIGTQAPIHSFACAPTGNAGLMMFNLTYMFNLYSSSMFNKLHMNKDCTAI
jgi:hypothetical protein